jgi:ketosteroid isomerase-like protein
MTTPVKTGDSPSEVVRAVIDLATQGVIGDAATQSRLAGRLAELYADPTYVLHPLRPDLPPLVHHDDFRRHAEAIGQNRPRPEAFRAVDIVTHATTDPELVVTEFRYEMTVNGTTMIMPCIWVTRVRDGHIIEARDYNGDPHPRNPISMEGTVDRGISSGV